MIPRTLEAEAREALRGYPIVAITGPRQSGKTTLAMLVRKGRPYISLEDPGSLQSATRDPRRFLSELVNGAVLDEVQRCPELFSYLQTFVDLDGRMGLFLLTGSQQFGFIESITQSLAGRVAMLTLLPFSLEELSAARRAPTSMNELLYTGFYPPIHDRALTPSKWLASYVITYVERDVRQLLRVQDLTAFQRFMRLCAGRGARSPSLSGLASDCGITHPTAAAWLSVLRASGLVFLAQPYYRNINRRMIKAPKLYFHDVGLMAWLLGIQAPEQVATHPLRGPLFETFVASELFKARAHRHERAELFFFRDKQGHEVDLLLEMGDGLHAVEIKSGMTIAADFFDGLDYFRKLLPGERIKPWLIYGGDTAQNREQATVVPWRQLPKSLGAFIAPKSRTRGALKARARATKRRRR